MKRFHAYVDPKYDTKNGEAPIYIKYYYDRTKRKFIPINYSVKIENWDFKKNWIKKSCSNYEAINETLIDLMARIGSILTYAKENEIDPTIDFVQLELAKKKEYDTKSKRTDLFAQLDKYIEEKKPRLLMM